MFVREVGDFEVKLLGLQMRETFGAQVGEKESGPHGILAETEYGEAKLFALGGVEFHFCGLSVVSGQWFKKAAGRTGRKILECGVALRLPPHSIKSRV